MRAQFVLVMALAAACLTVAACGGKERYPAAVERNFTKECAAKAPLNLCRCALARLEDTMSLKEFLRQEAAIRSHRPTSRKLDDAVVDCVSK